MNYDFRTFSPDADQALTDQWVQAVHQGFHEARPSEETLTRYRRRLIGDNTILRGVYRPTSSGPELPVDRPVATFASFEGTVTMPSQAPLANHMITDVKLQMSPRYSVMPGATGVFDTWWAIVTGAQGIPGELELSPEILEAYKSAEALLQDEEGEATRRYEKYLDLADEYDNALTDYNLEFADAVTDPEKLAMWPMTGNLLRKKVDRAFDRWAALGSKEKIESALATLAAQGQDPAIALIGRAKKELQANLFDFPGVGPLPITTILPSNWANENDNRGWNTYTKTDFHSETHYSESSTSIKTRGGINLGFWSAGGGLDKHDEKQHMDFQTDNLEISFSYMVADVHNAVVKPTLLNLKSWFLFGDYPKHTVSTGLMGQQVPTDGNEPVFLPSMITGLILIKDLRIKWDNWKGQWDNKTSSFSANTSVGWGPFAIKGGYGSKNHSFDTSTDHQSEGLVTEGIQLVGYVSQIMPASPQVDSKDHMQKVISNRQPEPANS